VPDVGRRLQVEHNKAWGGGGGVACVHTCSQPKLHCLPGDDRRPETVVDCNTLAAASSTHLSTTPKTCHMTAGAAPTLNRQRLPPTAQRPTAVAVKWYCWGCSAPHTQPLGPPPSYPKHAVCPMRVPYFSITQEDVIQCLRCLLPLRALTGLYEHRQAATQPRHNLCGSNPRHVGGGFRRGLNSHHHAHHVNMDERCEAMFFRLCHRRSETHRSSKTLDLQDSRSDGSTPTQAVVELDAKERNHSLSVEDRLLHSHQTTRHSRSFQC
jgi:hypothetical protein